MNAVRHIEAACRVLLTGELVCSRLSAHFSVGTVSLREAWQQTLERRDELKRKPGEAALCGA